MSATLVIASSNQHKVQELSRMLEFAGVGVDVCSMQSLGAPPEVPETAPDFSGNAALKSVAIARWVKAQSTCPPGACWVLADDSGLCVEALGGAPGVLSARFAGPEATDEQNNAKLVKELEALGLQQSPAHFCCVLALTRVDHALEETQFFEGQARGFARTEPAGQGGFGYDPHVWIEGQVGSFAQMTRDEKAKISHRGLALAALLAALPSILRDAH